MYNCYLYRIVAVQLYGGNLYTGTNKRSDVDVVFAPSELELPFNLPKVDIDYHF